MSKIWYCKIGEIDDQYLMHGADKPMRDAVKNAYMNFLGPEPNFIFSGWGSKLTEAERAVVENREPNDLLIERAYELLRLHADGTHISSEELVPIVKGLLERV